jgi:SiaC family regulatory phosphoprotein
MEGFYTDRTIKSPLIKGNLENGEILIQGRSYPESALEFYRPFREWLTEFLLTEPNSISFTMDMEYFNTSTDGVLFEIIISISEMHEKSDVQIIWKYETDDIDMLNKGQSLKQHFGDIIILDGRSEDNN